MTTRLQFLAGVRAELGDNGPNFVWPDSLLQSFLSDALNQLSIDWAPVRELSLVAVNNQRDYALDPVANPVGPAGVISVQYPAGFVVWPGDSSAQYVQMFPTITNGSTWQPFDQRWEYIAGVGTVAQLLRFRYPLVVVQPATVIVRYWSVYTPPVSDSALLDVAISDEVALKWASCARAMEWLDEQRGKRSAQAAGPVNAAQAVVAGARRTQSYYQRLYNSAIIARNRAYGVQSSKVVLDG